MKPQVDPEAAVYYRLQMANGWAFNLNQSEGEQLCEKLASLTTAPNQPRFLRVEDMSGADQVVGVEWIHGVYFSTPAQRAFDKQWNAEVEKRKDWDEKG